MDIYCAFNRTFFKTPGLNGVLPGFKGSALTYGESHFKPIRDLLQRLEMTPEDQPSISASCDSDLCFFVLSSVACEKLVTILFDRLAKSLKTNNPQFDSLTSSCSQQNRRMSWWIWARARGVWCWQLPWPFPSCLLLSSQGLGSFSATTSEKSRIRSEENIIIDNIIIDPHLSYDIIILVILNNVS